MAKYLQYNNPHIMVNVFGKLRLARVGLGQALKNDLFKLITDHGSSLRTYT